MAKVQIVDVEVLDNPSNFFNPFQFQITFDCMENLRDDLEWKIIYVGSAESEAYDQVLDSVLVGPIPAGRHKFVFQADPPKPEGIPAQDAVGVTVVILTCTYHGHEFVRVGYYVNNEYTDSELRENPPETTDFSKLSRNILSSAPRVTRFTINWDDAAVAAQADQSELGAKENVPPSPPPGVSYTESMLEDIHQAMGGAAREACGTNSDSNGPLCSSILKGENTSSTPQSSAISKPIAPCLENSIDALDAQMMVE